MPALRRSLVIAAIVFLSVPLLALPPSRAVTAMVREPAAGAAIPPILSVLPASTAAAVPEIRIFPTGLTGSRPQGIALDNDGSLWFSDAGADRVGHFNPATASFTTYPLPRDSRAQAITVDNRSGDVYLALSPPNNDPNHGGRISATGRLPAGSAPDTKVTVFEEVEIGQGAFDPSRNLSADGIAVDAAGLIWTTHTENTVDYGAIYHELMRTARKASSNPPRPANT